jgi:chemotaxis response regulator CheB
MRDVVMSVLSRAPHIEIVGEVGDEANIADAIDQKQPDVLVIALEDSTERPRLCDEVLKRHPEMKILAVSPRCDRSVSYWASLDIHSRPVEGSEEGMLNFFGAGTAAGGQP